MRRDRDNQKPFKKIAGAGDDDNPDTQSPVFSFEKMQDGTGWSINCCDAENQAALSKQLFRLCQMKWREVIQAPRHGLGSEKIDVKSLKIPLPKSVTQDVTILALRYHGKRPMVGYREGRVFFILFLDHNFKIYNHG